MSLDQLQPYFGLRDRPFRADIAPSALHRSTAHQEAIARIAYLVQAGALGLITGEVGCGKTTALRAASAALDASRHTVIYLPNPAIGARGIYAEDGSASPLKRSLANGMSHGCRSANQPTKFAAMAKIPGSTSE